MEIGSIGRDYRARSAKPGDASPRTDAATEASSGSSGRKEELYNPLVHGLTSLTKATEDVEEQIKARAKRKLEDAKQQLAFMRRWGFAPDVIAKQAAQLGVIVAGAAREFAEALTGGGGLTSFAPADTPSTADTADPVLDQSKQAASGDRSVEDTRPVSHAERAYLEEMGETPRNTPRLSADDIKTAMEFSSVARQIKALLEEAARKLREQNGTAALSGAQNLDASVNALTSTVSALPTVSITI